MRRRLLVLVALLAFTSLGAQHRTPNFIVHAPNAQIAERVGQYAEHYRREKAMLWLGREMPQWREPCPLHVKVTMDGPSGATSFHFGQGQVLSQTMEIQGPLDRLIESVLPHEITHTVFAFHFRQPVPRWADEGGSVLSEDDLERTRHDQLARDILNQRRQIPMRRLFTLKDYPRDVLCLYAQGFSICDFLVKRGDRKTFLSFVGHGMMHGWDSASASFYGHRSVEDLEEAWLQNLRETRKQRDTLVAQNKTKPSATLASRNLVRTTVPPTQPLDAAPVARGAMPQGDQQGQVFGNAPPPPPGQWQPVYPVAGPTITVPPSPQVQVGPPQFLQSTPVGFPH